MAKLAAKSCPYRPLSEYVYHVVTSKKKKQNKTKQKQEKIEKKIVSSQRPALPATT